jgi:hypothetical protein
VADTFNGQLLELLNRIAVALETIASRSEPTESTEIAPEKIERPLAPRCDPARLAPMPPPVVEEKPLDASHPLVEFLATRKIAVKTLPEVDEGDEVLGRLAQQIGSRYTSVKKLLDAIKWSLRNGKPINLFMKNERQEVVSNTCQIASMLHEIAFLTRYRYERSPKFLLRAEPSRFPRAINFFTGGWLERYIKNEVLAALNWSRPGKPVHVLQGAQITLPNGDDFELDLLVASEEDIYWFEVKSGDYQQYVQKYAKMSSLLGLGPSHSVMVLADLSRTTASAIASLFKMTVVSIADVSTFLESVFGVPPDADALAMPAAAPVAVSPAATASSPGTPTAESL